MDELKKVSQKPQTLQKAPPPKGNMVPITKLGSYQLQTHFGGLTIKAIPIPGGRVILVGNGCSKVVDDVKLVNIDGVYSLK